MVVLYGLALVLDSKVVPVFLPQISVASDFIDELTDLLLLCQWLRDTVLHSLVECFSGKVWVQSERSVSLPFETVLDFMIDIEI